MISRVSRNYNVDVNIVLANIDIITDEALGGIIATIEGTADNVSAAMEYIHSCGVETEVIENA